MRQKLSTAPQVKVQQAGATFLAEAGLISLCGLFAHSRADQRILQRAFEQSAGKFGEQVGGAILEQAATEFVNWLLGSAPPAPATQGVVLAPQLGSFRAAQMHSRRVRLSRRRHR